LLLRISCARIHQNCSRAIDHPIKTRAHKGEHERAERGVDVHEVCAVGECAGEDAVEETVPQHGVAPQPDPDCPIEVEPTETQVSKNTAIGGGLGLRVESVLRGSTGA